MASGTIWLSLPVYLSFAGLQVPDTWTVARGHSICEEIELAIRHDLPESAVFTHLEPREDPRSFADQALDRVLVSDELSETAPALEGREVKNETRRDK